MDFVPFFLKKTVKAVGKLVLKVRKSVTSSQREIDRIVMLTRVPCDSGVSTQHKSVPSFKKIYYKLPSFITFHCLLQIQKNVNNA